MGSLRSSDPCLPGLSPSTIWNCCTRGGCDSDDITKVGVEGGGDAEPGGSDDAMTMTIALFSLYILAKCVKT